MIARRDFLTAGAAATVAAAGHTPQVSAAAAARIERRVKLGKTGLEVSDIGFGSSSSADPALVRHALDRGVTYFDTAESYRGGRAEKAIGKGLHGVRDRVVVASKTKAGAREDRASMMRALEGSLHRLRTDYVDIYYNHAVNNVARMRNDEWAEFTELAKRQGKIRFRGMSGHGSKLVPCLHYALDNDLVDVVLVAFNFGQDPDFYDRLKHTFHFVAIQEALPRALKKARAKNVGVVAMKTLMGARLNDMRPYERDGHTFSQAAFRWVLSSPLVDSLIVSMRKTSQIDEYVSASGEPKLALEDLHQLELYAALQGERYCRPGCDACAGSCPENVPIAEVLRTRMYAVDYDDVAYAREDYAKLDIAAGACIGCAHRACMGACPHNLPIAALTRDAAMRLG
ncbi:MAG: aldo/keto reductase [Gammaproteobacteria bacterium]